MAPDQATQHEPLLVPAYIQHMAAERPTRICFEYYRSKQLEDGVRQISFRQLQKAIDFASSWIERTLGTGNDYETFAYIGPQDSRYLILGIAAWNTRWKLFAPSPQNSLEAHSKLLHDFQCSTFLYADEMAPAKALINTIGTQVPLRSLPVPSQDELFSHSANIAPSWPCTKTFKDASLEPLMALHTSGTTGLPKPIVLTQGSWATLHAISCIASSGATTPYLELWRGYKIFVPFPMFHSAGFGALIAALYFDQTFRFAPSGPPNAELYYQVLKQGGLDVAAIPPSILAEMSRIEDHVNALRLLKFVMTGGGPLPHHAGAVLARVTHLMCGFGSTEVGTLPNIVTDAEDWAYINFSRYTGVEMRPYADGLYESVFVRRPKLKYYQAVFYTLPHLKEYSTTDLWSKHPAKEGLWKHETRLDDIVVYSTGEKYNPIAMEGIIGAHPRVSTALILGRGRPMSTLLVELTSGEIPGLEDDHEAAIKDIWPLIETANEQCPGFARIVDGMILLAHKGEPLPRAGKGTIQRRLAEKLYEPDMDRAYERYAEVKCNGEGSNIEPNMNQSTLKVILDSISAYPGYQTLQLTDNIFDRGFDSLNVMTLTRTLNLKLNLLDGSQALSHTTIYSNPTAVALAAAIDGEPSAQKCNVTPQEFFDKYRLKLPLTTRPFESPRETGYVVLLTESTGSLGSYLLRSLLSRPTINKIYCLNRGTDSGGRQEQAGRKRGLEYHFQTDKVEFIEYSSSTATGQYLGLGVDQYKKLCQEVTHVIHNAWQVDFNLPLAHYADTHVRGVHELIVFSSSSLHNASIHFVSSIGTVGNFEGESVPEEVFVSFDLPEKSGYAESKFVAERLLAEASAISNVPSSIYRVGQITGSTVTQGIWNANEWFPLIVRSATALGGLPQTLGPYEEVDWLPVDVVAQSLVELIMHDPDRSKECQVYHLVNPRKTSYTKLLPEILGALGMEVPLVPFDEWVAKLEESSRDPEAGGKLYEQIPALRLLGFYQSLVMQAKVGKKQLHVKTAAAERGSKTLRAADVISGEHISKWLRQWDL